MPNNPTQLAHQAVSWLHPDHIWNAAEAFHRSQHATGHRSPVTMGRQRRSVHVQTATERALKDAPRLAPP